MKYAGIVSAILTAWAIALSLPAAAQAQGVNQIIQGTIPALMGGQARGAGVRNGLPPTSMDSFVYEAFEYADAIYGDEGVGGLPPYFGFDKTHRIDTGIVDTRDAGLTNGHGSYMPDAVGRDEFLGAEWSQSGARGVSQASGMYMGTPQMMDPGLINMTRQVDLLSAPGDVSGTAGGAQGGGGRNGGGGASMPGLQIPGLPMSGQLPGLPGIPGLPIAGVPTSGMPMPGVSLPGAGGGGGAINFDLGGLGVSVGFPFP
jgi:hypothetical protein